jgi:hypothetical protein
MVSVHDEFYSVGPVPDVVLPVCAVSLLFSSIRFYDMAYRHKAKEKVNVAPHGGETQN